MTAPAHYRPPGRLTPAMPGYFIPDPVPGVALIVYPHAILAGYVGKPPPDASLDMVVAIHASKIAIEEVDEILKKLSNIPK